MEEKSSELFGVPVEKAKRLANSQAGQKLYSLIKNNPSVDLQTAMKQAAAGNLSAVQQTLRALLADEEARRLLNDLRE